MGNDRYPRGTNPQGDYYNRSERQDYGRDYGSGRSNSYSSARDYEAAGRGDDERGDHGRRDYGNSRYGQREQGGQGGRDYYGGRNYGAYGNRDQGRDQGDRYGGRNQEYHGSYSSDGRRFEDVGRDRHADDDYRRSGNQGQGGYGRQPQGYDYEERGFFQRAGDEVRSWFGDEDAERRRDADSRNDERYNNDRDSDYHSWRRGQIDALDRDYHEYRQENRTRFNSEFGAWRTSRQGQRDSLGKVTEHMDVVGSDGEHVGTVDKVKGDQILLTKNDADAGGRHHVIPSRWIQTVDTKVTLSKTAADAKAQWQEEDSNQAMFGFNDKSDDRGDKGNDRSGSQGNLNKSFSGTY